MGKRRGQSNRNWQKSFDPKPEEDAEMEVPFKLSRRFRRQRRKNQMKAKVREFATACAAAVSLEHATGVKALPPVVHHVDLNPAMLSNLSCLVNRYINAFEAGQLRKSLIDFYAPDAYFTLQITPYLGSRTEVDDKHIKRCKLKVQPGWVAYERFACNLIPGAVPLPGWAWANLCNLTTAQSKSQRSGYQLGKHDRQHLKVLRAFQSAHSERLKSVCRSASSAPDRWLEGVPLPPMARREARGHADILGLLSRLPDLIHIRADECCCLDVITAESDVVCFRYYCLAAELIPPSADVDEYTSKFQNQLLDISPHGKVLVRGIHRCLLILPQFDGKIVQEDCGITPVPSSLLQQHATLIKDIVTKRLWEKTSNPPCNATDPAVQLALKELSALTGLNDSYAWQCLSECDFNLQTALDSFRKVMDANLLPPEAFSK